MRWFKHMSESWDDTRLSSVVDEHGLVGYGFWWRLIEIIATMMDVNEPPEHTLSLKGWSSLFRIYPKSFQKILRTFESAGLVRVEESHAAITVKIPNIVKYRDEWTKKKERNVGAPATTLRSKESESETESESDREKRRVVNARDPDEDSSVVRRLRGTAQDDSGESPSSQPSVDPPKPASDRPEFAIIQAFDDARGAAFGPTMRRTWPAQHDLITAQRWLKAGVDVETCRFVFDASFRTKAAKKEKPPDTLRYFDAAIADAIAQKSTALEIPDGHTEQTEPGNDSHRVERLRARARARNAERTLVCGAE